MIPILVAALAHATDDYRSHLDQADLFLRREWYADAIQELEAAVAHPDGRYDPDAWYRLATTRLAVADVAGARIAAERALTHARTTAEADRAEELVRYLADGFGTLEVVAPADGVAARLDLELRSLVLDARAQTLAEAIREQAREKATLPRTFTVPAGTWAVDGVEVQVLPNARVRVAPRLTRGLGAVVDRAEVEVGLGLAGWQGDPVPDHLPAPQARVAIGWAAGLVEIAAIASWAPQPYQRRDNAVQTGFDGGGAGLRLGVAMPDLAPWLVRPAVTGRVVWVPGQELSCLRDGDQFRCGRDGPADLVLYAPGRAIAPGASLTVARIERRRAFSVGAGVEGTLEAAFGTLAPGGEADPLSDGGVLRYTVAESDRSWTATGWSATVAVFLSL